MRGAGERQVASPLVKIALMRRLGYRLVVVSVMCGLPLLETRSSLSFRLVRLAGYLFNFSQALSLNLMLELVHVATQYNELKGRAIKESRIDLHCP